MVKIIKKWFQDKIGIGENRDRISFLEKKIDYSHSIIHQLLPEKLSFSQDLSLLPFFKETPEALETNLDIHKNDLMFLYPLLHHNGALSQSLNEYYLVGWQTAKLLFEIGSQSSYWPEGYKRTREQENSTR